MYPKSFVDLFPVFPRNDQVFVAMSFNPALSLRYEAVIEPAIRSCGLLPIRVDKTQISDSILTDILKGVAHSLLVFADLTGPNGAASPNVMYEVGLAHALRLPPEVILFRSDSGHPPFDLSNVRINKYDPEGDTARARQLIVSAVEDARRELDSTKHLIVQDLADQLEHATALTLLEVDQPWDVPVQSVEHSFYISSGPDFKFRLQTLLEMRLVQCVFEETPWIQEMDWIRPMRCVRITALGRAVSARLLFRIANGGAIRQRKCEQLTRDLLSATEDPDWYLFSRQDGYSIPATLTREEKQEMLAYVKANAVGNRVDRQSTQIDVLVHRWEKQHFWPARIRAEKEKAAREPSVSKNAENTGGSD